MCEPTSIMMGVSAAASIAGGIMSNQAKQSVSSAVSSANNAYEQRLGTVQDEANQVMTDTASQVGRDASDQQQAGVEAEKQTRIAEAMKAPASSGVDVTRASSNPVVAEAYETQAKDALTSALGYGNTQSKLSAWQQNRFLKDLAVNDSAIDMARLGSQAQGWGNVWRSELNSAQSAGDKQAGLGSLFSSIGSVSGMAGGSMSANPDLFSFGSGGNPSTTIGMTELPDGTFTQSWYAGPR